eukprot:scaffold48651_cov57-Phaeocystis_antarctica.AAC.2
MRRGPQRGQLAAVPAASSSSHQSHLGAALMVYSFDTRRSRYSSPGGRRDNRRHGRDNRRRRRQHFGRA